MKKMINNEEIQSKRDSLWAFGRILNYPAGYYPLDKAKYYMAFMKRKNNKTIMCKHLSFNIFNINTTQV